MWLNGVSGSSYRITTESPVGPIPAPGFSRRFSLKRMQAGAKHQDFGLFKPWSAMLCWPLEGGACAGNNCEVRHVQLQTTRDNNRRGSADRR